LGHLPSASFDISQAWLAAATIACDLLCWTPNLNSLPRWERGRVVHPTRPDKHHK
jgi:hypothetical protein